MPNGRNPKAAVKSTIKVGVTLYIRDGHQTIWENGIFQNCFFLIQLLSRSPLVEKVFIVNGGPGKPDKASRFLADAPAPVVSLAEALNELDIVIELSAQLNAEWGQQFVAKGGRLIGMHVANDFVIDSERLAFQLDPGMLLAPVPYSEIWTLPAFARTCAEYYRVGFRAPVRVMQHLWSPELVERNAQAVGRSFAYIPGRKRWRLAILEPNICTVKTCHLPMLLCDVAHRRQPTIIEYLRIFNTIKMKENAMFVSFAGSLDLVRQGLATFEPRMPVFDIMGPIADAIVSHQWENAQNYLYYEALYAGFPLLHNSTYLGDCGYNYMSFDPEDGALALIQAFRTHDLQIDEYRRRATDLLSELDPINPLNIHIYSDALARVLKSEPRQ